MSRLQTEPDTVVSEVLQGEPVSVVWHLKDWKDNRELLLNRATCPVEIDFGPATGVVRLCFFLKNTTLTSTGHTQKYYTLCVKGLQGRRPLSFQLSTETSNETGAVDDGYCKSFNVTLDQVNPKTDATGYTVITESFVYKSSIPDRSNHVKIKLSVVPLIVTGDELLSSDTHKRRSSEASLSNDLKFMFQSEDNLVDLKLEMKDNFTLSAHRFILCARSPVLRTLISEELKKEGFDGTIRITTVNGKPMGAILHWMYTGELQENAGNFMMEIVEAALLFQLNSMMEILDKKLISICNKQNMFHLYRVAEKNAFPTAIAQLRQFIKENI